jgi:hypothetical protein
VFLAPTFTQQLRRLHWSFHASLIKAGLTDNPYYEPDQWGPHCIMTTDIDPKQVSLAVQTLVEMFNPFETQCISIGVISLRPVSTQACFRLNGAGSFI